METYRELRRVCLIPSKIFTVHFNVFNFQIIQNICLFINNMILFQLLQHKHYVCKEVNINKDQN